jgi:hypothetical protein
MNISLTTCLIVEIFVAAIISAVGSIHRRDEVNAYRAWRDNPRAETRAAFDTERAITVRHHVVFAAALFGVMAIITVPVVRILNGRKSSAAEEVR